MKLFEILTGIEIYQLPEMFGHKKVSVFLEPIEDILIRDVPYSKQDENTIYFNTSGYAEALVSGFLPAVECLFIDKSAITLDPGLEYEELRINRSQFVTKNYFDRAISEFEEVFKYSETIVKSSPKNKEQFKKEWKECIRVKLYCTYQLDSLIKILKNKDIPGEAFNIKNFYDVEVCNKNIETLKEQAISLGKDLPEKCDYIFIIKSLRVDYFQKIKLFVNE